jgi:branched-subunit amino acid transport protein
MEQSEIFLIILGMALVTFIPRLMPPLMLSSRSLPPRVIEWLRFIPVSVLSAMLLPSLIMKQEGICLLWKNPFLVAAVPTFFIAWKTRGLLGAVIAGMAVVALLRVLGW